MNRKLRFKLTVIVLLSFLCLNIFILKGFGDTTTTTAFTLQYPQGTAFNIQEGTPGEYITISVNTGNLYGTALLTTNSSGGTLVVLPTATGVFTPTSTGAGSVYVNSVNYTGSPFSFSSGVIFTVTWGWATYYLTMQAASGSGTVNPVAGTYEIDANYNQTLLATPAVGYSFAAWSIDGVNQTTTSSTWYVVMNANHTAKAYFAANTYTLSTSVTGSGTITANATAPYSYGQAVSLTANASSGWLFVSWGGDLSGSTNPQSILMTSNRTVSASFVYSATDLTVSLVDPIENLTATTYTVNFAYYPITRSDPIISASLWINGSEVLSNTTAVVNGTTNSLQYTFVADGTYIWNVEVTNSTHSVFATVDRTLHVLVTPPPSTDSQISNLWYLSTVRTTNTVTGYTIAFSSGWTNGSAGGQAVPESAVVQFGFRAYLVHSDATEDALTGENVVGIITRSSSGQGMQNGTCYVPRVNLVLGMNAIKVNLYIRFDYGEWTLLTTYVSDLLVKKAIEAGTWTFNLYTKVLNQAGNTYATAYWGNQMCLSGLGGVVFKEPLPQEVALNFGNTGDFFGMVIYPFIYVVGDIFYGIALLFVGSVLYVRHRKWEVILILFLLFGGGTGFGLLIPSAAYRVIFIMILFIITMIYYRLVR